MGEDEKLQQRLRKVAASPKNSTRLRTRTVIEHRLAHIAARKRPKARYRGLRPNVFDLRRAATILNLETIQRVQLKAAGSRFNLFGALETRFARVFGLGGHLLGVPPRDVTQAFCNDCASSM